MGDEVTLRQSTCTALLLYVESVKRFQYAEQHPELQEQGRPAALYEELVKVRDLLALELSAMDASYAIAIMRVATLATR